MNVLACCFDVSSITDTVVVATNEDIEVIAGEYYVVCAYETWDEFGEGEIKEWDPARIDDVDEHEDLGGRDVDEYVACFDG